MPPALHLEPLEDRCVPTVVSLGPTEVGIFNQGTWTLDINDNHNLDSTDTTFVYGLPTDTPVTGDWTASGHTAVGVFRNVNGVGQWILDINNNHVYDAGDRVFFYGLGTDTPVTGDWSGNGSSKVGVFRNVNGVANGFSTPTATTNMIPPTPFSSTAMLSISRWRAIGTATGSLRSASSRTKAAANLFSTSTTTMYWTLPTKFSSTASAPTRP